MADVLEQLGLTAAESRVYLALLDIGAATVGPITKHARVASSKTYELLDRLAAKGLVTSWVEEGRRRFSAVDPHQLKEVLSDKKAALDQVDAKLSAELPSLLARYQDKAGQRDVEVFTGYRGVAAAFRDMVRTLKRGDEFLVMGGGDTPTANPRTKAFFERLHKERSKKGIVLRIIFSEARRASLRKQAMFPHTHARYLPYGTPSTINIYGDTTVLLVMSPSPAAIRIRNRQMTQTYLKHFEQMWRQARP